MTAAPAYASFGRRFAALAIDAALLLAAVVAIVLAANSAFGPVLSAFWSSEPPAHTRFELASRTESRLDDGTVRENTVGRDTRLFRDGTVRIYMVSEARFVAAGGVVTTSRVENLIGRSAGDRRRAWLTGFLAFALSFAYFAAFEASAAQATPGKLLLGLRVSDLAGRRLGVARSLWRQTMKCAEVASSGITYLIAAFTQRRQALHDMFAGTVVTLAPAAAAQRRAAAFQEG